MNLQDFATQVSGFAELSHPEKIKHLVWYLHAHKQKERVSADDIRSCYAALHYDAPTLPRDLARLVERGEVLRDGGGHRLEGRERSVLDTKYRNSPSTIAVDQLLSDLPSRVPEAAQRVFLSEVINCYRVQAFRATTVMAWNLAFDHLLRWLLDDATRLASFNTRISVRFPKKVGVVITDFDGLEDLKESEIIEIASSAGLIPNGMVKVLNKELGRRNSAAHPSSVVITQYQANDTISDLVNNVILKLS